MLTMLRTRDEPRAALAEALGLPKATSEDRLVNLTEREQLMLTTVEEMRPDLAVDVDRHRILWGTPTA